MGHSDLDGSYASRVRADVPQIYRLGSVQAYRRYDGVLIFSLAG